jgi:threonine/homoserine/homoserine lactone efflux protein
LAFVTADQAFAFLLFAVVAAITPGPSNIILTSTGAAVGVRRGLPTLLGVAIGMGLMMAIVAFGLGSLVLDHPVILRALKWGGIGFLLWLAWKIATAEHGDETSTRDAIGFRDAAAFQWINPKSWLVSASAAATYLHADEGAIVQSLAFGALFVLAALPSCFVWLAFGASVQRFLRSPRASRLFNLGMAALLAGSVTLFLLE